MIDSDVADGPRPVMVVVDQHVEEVVHLRNVRAMLVRAPHVRRLHLGRLDERLAAHLDGVAEAGDCGAAATRRVLERPGRGELFLVAVQALRTRQQGRLDELLAIVEAVPASRSGLLSAFGWTSRSALQGLAKDLFESANPRRREIGLAACALHLLNPGAALDAALRDADVGLRARAFRVAGRCGRVDLVEECLAGLADADEACAFEAAVAAVLLGDRTASLRTLESLAATSRATERKRGALQLLARALDSSRARAMLSALADDNAAARTLIRGIAAAGDPHYVPWLISQMSNLELARLAGEAFSVMTGLDLAHLDLELKPPQHLEFGPNDDPNDEDVAMDEDEGLPWPDPHKLAAWWQKKGASFVPGTRYFMGVPPTREHCTDVLRTGFQRQRIAAAEHLCLMSPGTPLFNTAAPAWRQHRLLTRASG